jgi:hypothetical protein
MCEILEDKLKDRDQYDPLPTHRPNHGSSNLSYPRLSIPYYRVEYSINIWGATHNPKTKRKKTRERNPSTCCIIAHLKRHF